MEIIFFYQSRHVYMANQVCVMGYYIYFWRCRETSHATHTDIGQDPSIISSHPIPAFKSHCKGHTKGKAQHYIYGHLYEWSSHSDLM